MPVTIIQLPPRRPRCIRNRAIQGACGRQPLCDGVQQHSSHLRQPLYAQLSADEITDYVMQHNPAIRTSWQGDQSEPGQPFAYSCGLQLIQVGCGPPQPGHQAEWDGLVLDEHTQLSEPLRVVAAEQADAGPDGRPHCPRPLFRLVDVQAEAGGTQELINDLRPGPAQP